MKQCLWKWTTLKGASILYRKCLLGVPIASETPSSPHHYNVGYNHKHLIPTMVGEDIIQLSSDTPALTIQMPELCLICFHMQHTFLCNFDSVTCAPR